MHEITKAVGPAWLSKVEAAVRELEGKSAEEREAAFAFIETTEGAEAEAKARELYEAHATKVVVEERQAELLKIVGPAPAKASGWPKPAEPEELEPGVEAEPDPAAAVPSRALVVRQEVLPPVSVGIKRWRL